MRDVHYVVLIRSPLGEIVNDLHSPLVIQNTFLRRPNEKFLKKKNFRATAN